jgi:hypothetical protein
VVNLWLVFSIIMLSEIHIERIRPLLEWRENVLKDSIIAFFLFLAIF